MRLSKLNDHPRLWLWMTLFWMAVIFFLSSPYFSSNRTNNYPFPFNVRILAHIFVYFCLGFLSSGAVDLNFNWRKKATAALAFCVFYALTDEFHQHFVPGRHGRINEVLIDTMGSFLGIFFYYHVYLRLAARRKR